MPNKYLSAKGSERLDLEREQIEARLAELRKKEDLLRVQQRDTIGSLLLGAVADGTWSDAQLHDLLRPLLKRKRDFEILGISAEETPELGSATEQKSLNEDADDDDGLVETDEDDSSSDPVSPFSSSSINQG